MKKHEIPQESFNFFQQSTNSTMKNNHYYPNETTQAAQPAQTYQQTHYTHSHNALEPGAINTLHGDEIQIYLTCPQFSPLVFHSHGLFLFFGSGFPIFFFGSFKFDGGILWCCIHIRSLFCALSRIFGFVRVRGWIASGFPEQASEDDVKRLFSNQPGYMDLSFRAPPGKRPCAWILFQSVDYAVSAKAMLDGTQVYGKSIRVGYAKSEMKSKRGSAPSPMHSMNYSQVPQASVYDRKMAYNSPHGQQSYASRPNNPYQTTPGGPTAAINTLYITSLSYQTGEGDVRSMLQDFEGYRGMSFVQKSGRNPHAFVLFTDSQTATVALNAINGKMLHGRPIRVQYAKSEMHARNAR